MQLISVERWTFWAALATAFFGPILSAVLVPGAASDGTTFALPWVSVVLVLLLASVALGGSRDPSVRRVPVQPDA